MVEMKKKFKLGTFITGIVTLAIMIYYCVKEYNVLLLCFIVGFTCFLVILSIYFSSWMLFLFTIFIILMNISLSDGTASYLLMIGFGVAAIAVGGPFYYSFSVMFPGSRLIDGKDEKYFLDYLVKYWWVATIFFVVIFIFLTSIEDMKFFMLMLYEIPITTYGYAMLRYKKACEKRKKAIWPMVNP